MTAVPREPGPFFEHYVPRRFEMVRAALGAVTSPGSIAVRVGEAGEYSYRIVQGELRVELSAAADAIVRVSMGLCDFERLIVRGAELAEEADVGPERQLLAFKALRADEERVEAIRSLRSSIAIDVDDAGERRSVLIAAGDVADTAEPACRLAMSMDDFMDLQAGRQNPMQLLMDGRLRIMGNAQILMVLGSVLA